MNNRCFRLVFSELRGMSVAVSEAAIGKDNANHGETGHRQPGQQQHSFVTEEVCRGGERKNRCCRDHQRVRSGYGRRRLRQDVESIPSTGNPIIDGSGDFNGFNITGDID
ncbi:ESPR-type extended signal peptide-containing protein [Paraburkholderia lycopersici]|uniref:ESPR-type extended signal peptide-containing protein n=1 Tax=Paraburkholderia lycopersici TaxID=416944 RepID=UPI000B84CDA7|nr:ESPR-type extended signal peptide-containing protein [Paraburkholderia lycopersici]